MRVLIVLAILATPYAIFALPLRESSIDLIESRGNVKFYLYTRSNPNKPQELFVNDDNSIRSSHFEKSRHTKIVIHGWGGKYTHNQSIREAYLAQDNYNVIMIDWDAYARLNYVSARAKVPVVGEDIAEFLDYLHEKFNFNFDMVVVIGHSLGAHVAGFCGKHVRRGRIAAIVGLDPAFPLYNFDKPETRLASSDAKYVETIQTNGNMKGFLKPIGLASFYANYGRIQPGCGLDIDGSCSHGRCVAYISEAIRGYSYTTYRCHDYENISNKSGCDEHVEGIQIGDPLQINRIAGIYHFETNAETPFGHLTNKD